MRKLTFYHHKCICCLCGCCSFHIIERSFYEVNSWQLCYDACKIVRWMSKWMKNGDFLFLSFVYLVLLFYLQVTPKLQISQIWASDLIKHMLMWPQFEVRSHRQHLDLIVVGNKKHHVKIDLWKQFAFFTFIFMK